MSHTEIEKDAVWEERGRLILLTSPFMLVTNHYDYDRLGTLHVTARNKTSCLKILKSED
jgi:hypothetical protein